jgi:hypothetical protein
MDVRDYLENLQDTKKTDLLHGSPGVNPQNDLISSTSSLGWTGAPHEHERSPDASNRQCYKWRGTWVRHKTERGDWGDCRDVLTNGGDGRMWSDFEEDGGGRPWWPARSPCNSADSVDLRRRYWVTGAQLGIVQLLVMTASPGNAASCRARRWTGTAACSPDVHRMVALQWMSSDGKGRRAWSSSQWSWWWQRLSPTMLHAGGYGRAEIWPVTELEGNGGQLGFQYGDGKPVDLQG